MQERWKAVPGFEELYEASDTGKLRRIATPTGKPKCKVIAPHKKRNGYTDYWLYAGGLKKRISGHRLVWITFCGEIPKDLQINHKNGVRHDNRISNLELATRSWNAAHSYQVLKRPAPNYPSVGEKNGCAKLTADKVRAIRALYADRSLNQYQLARKFRVSQSAITLIVRRKKWAHLD